MNQNYIIGGIVALLLIGGGIWYSMSNSTGSSDIATTTPQTTTQSTTNTTTPPPQATQPSAVTSTSVSPSGTTAIVNGTVNPKGAFTSYWYEYGTNSNLGSKTPNQTMGSGFISIQAPGYIVDLTKNTTYYFRLVAENQYGRVAGTQYTFRTTDGTPAPVGTVPTTKTISASGISRTTANINGEITPNKATTQYWFEYGKTANLGNTSALSSAGDGNAKVSVSASLSGLDPLTTYYFRINAQNQFGTINGSILNFKTTGPAAATVPKVVSQNATLVTTVSATLHGTVNPNGAETKYWFEYSTKTLIGSVLLSATEEVLIGNGNLDVSASANISNLSPNTTYFFRLVSQNDQGLVRGSQLTFKTK